MNLDAVLKVGGSLSRGPSLGALCREISDLAERYRLLVVPGGGEFADVVRTTYLRYNLDETSAHFMAVLAMDQCGYLLHRLIAGSLLTTDLGSAFPEDEPGRAIILLPSASIIQHDPLPHSWQVTSDTIAAWIAHKIGCNRLVLLKSIHGISGQNLEISSTNKIISDIKVNELDEYDEGVDDYLSRFLATADLTTWVINGGHPERLSELLDTGRTIGTRIVSSGK